MPKQTLKALDVRTTIRRWLILPYGTPFGYFHVCLRDGGFDIPSFVTFLKGMILDRLTAMSESRLVILPLVIKAIRETEKILIYYRSALNTSAKLTNYWASWLHQSWWVWVARSRKWASELYVGRLLECGTVRYGLRTVLSVTYKRLSNKSAYV